MTEKKKESFDALSLPRKDVPQLMLSRYRIYRDAENFTMVEAENALEAFKASGLQQAYRIERDMLFAHNVLNLQELEAPAEPPVPEPAAPVAAAALPPVEAAPVETQVSEPVSEPVQEAPTAASDAPLSDEEVNKLLQG